jgi:2-polyprenyl-3-methyl-5-hydroxy-6-metoxy-1,4-benzoquinol methylase
MKTTKDHVLWAYRLFLDREAESELACQSKIEDAPSTHELRKMFLASREFSEKNPDFSRGTEPDYPHIKVQVRVDDEQLASLFKHVQTSWVGLGESDPHWSVLVSARFKKANIKQTEEEFYASGDNHTKTFLAALARNGINVNRECLIDFGCGVGRLSQAFSKHFQMVVGVDISGAHLQVADAYYNRQGITNVTSVQLANVESIQTLPECDAFYTTIVLQHNPPPVMAYMLESLLGKLKSGGAGMFQLPTYSKGYSFDVDSYSKTMNQKKHIEMHVLPQREVHTIIRRAGCELVEMVKDYSVGNFGVSYQFLVRKP